MQSQYRFVIDIKNEIQIPDSVSAFDECISSVKKMNIFLNFRKKSEYLFAYMLKMGYISCVINVFIT